GVKEHDAVWCLERAERADGGTESLRHAARLWLDRAELRLRAGERGEAARAVKRAVALGPGGEDLWRAAGVYRGLGAYDEAAVLLEGLTRRSPGKAGLWVDLAESRLRSGERDAAERSLERAAGLSPGEEESRRLALLYGELGRFGRAEEMFAGLLRKRPRDAGLMIERASALFGSGDKDGGARLLGKALSSKPTARERHRAALAYQRMGEYRRAIAILEPLTRGGALAAEALKDKGICEHLRGSSERGVADLEAALRLEPGLLSAYLTLGAVHVSQGKEDEARKVYERGLAAAPREDEIINRDLLLRSLERIGESE
ncbi:tetratricopeptide repeat protein, partial [Elusimicrobiota bacterium]